MNIFDIFEDDPQPRSQRTPIDPLRKKALIDELVKKQNGRCMYCGRKVARDLFDLATRTRFREEEPTERATSSYCAAHATRAKGH